MKIMVFGFNLACCLAVNSFPHALFAEEGGFSDSCFSCKRHPCLFLDQWKQKHRRKRDVTAWYHTNGSICNEQPDLLTAMLHNNKLQDTAFLIPPQTMLQRHYTSLPPSSTKASLSSIPNMSSSQNVGTKHKEHDRPPALQTATADTQLLQHPNDDCITMIREQHHFQQNRDEIILWLQDDADCIDVSSSGDVNAWDIVLLLVFLFFGLNAALNLQQQYKLYPPVASSSWCNFNPRRPPNLKQQQHDLQATTYELECPCCCEAYDISLSWNKYHGAVVRLPILSQTCIHCYCLQCARQDRERLVELAETAMEQSCPLFFFWTSTSSTTTYNTAIRCPFCRQPNAFDVKTPILRPDAYTAYTLVMKKKALNEQMQIAY